jgi:hypothetical protein
VSTLSAKRRAYRPTARAVTDAYTPRVAELEREVAGWKKGVADANRIAQEHAARADRLEGELAGTRGRTDALYDVLGAARALIAAQLWMERVKRKGSVEREARLHDRNEALQRLRDTLAETRPALMGDR